MHEFDLGVWKAVFIHLLQILYVAGNNGIQKLNEQYDAHSSITRIYFLFVTDVHFP